MEPIRDPEGYEVKNLLHFSPISDKNVLEIGSGAGWLTRQYASETKRVLGIDSLFTELQKAKASQPLSTNNVFTMQAKGEALPFQPGSFDLVLLANSL